MTRYLIAIKPWSIAGKNSTDILFCQHIMKYKIQANFYFVQINLHQITDCIYLMLMSLQVLCHHVFMETFKMDSHYVAVHKAYFPSWGGGGSEPPTLNHPSTTNHPRQKKVLCLVCTDFTFKLIHCI